MLCDLRGVFAEALFQPLHKVHQVLHGVLLITDLLFVARIIDDIIEDLTRVDILLTCMKESSEEELQFLGHLYTQLYSLSLCLVVLALLSPVSDLGVVEFLSHVRQEEKGLDE